LHVGMHSTFKADIYIRRITIFIHLFFSVSAVFFDLWEEEHRRLGTLQQSWAD